MTTNHTNPADRAKKGLNIRLWWARCEGTRVGRWLFSVIVGLGARYTGSIGARVQSVDDGGSVVTMRDRPKVRNHLKSVHAIALMNLGELSTGLATLFKLGHRGRGIIKGLRMEYTKKARGTITAHCSAEVPETAGQHDVTVEGILTDAQGDEVARCFATWRIEVY